MPAKIDDLRLFLEQRIIRIPIAGCWLWTGSVRSTGYASTNLISSPESSGHRLSWTIYKGPIPTGMHVLHKCDTRSCINPHHLFLGTNADNARDRDAKNRGVIPLGEHNGRAKLTAQQVLDIREDGRSTKEIAAQYNVLVRHINFIRKRQTWRHL
jgi:hypothetical protein